jgi:hypothetical protein
MNYAMPEPAQPNQDGAIGRFFSTLVFWWLTAMATATLFLAATVPSWVEYRQVAQVRDQIRQQIQYLQRRVDRNNYFIQSYKSPDTSPQALDLLAISEFGYRRPDEAPLPLPQQIVTSVRPAGYTGISGARAAAGPASQPALRSRAQLNSIEKFVARAQALANEYLGRRRAIGVVEMFCDRTARTGLAAAALGVLAAAFFLCRPRAADTD